jgi:hypothetical protein
MAYLLSEKNIIVDGLFIVREKYYCLAGTG